jgi:hypothetical protein
MIEGACISTTDIDNFTIDGVIDHFELSREDMQKAKDEDYMNSAESVTEHKTDGHHIITVFDYDGEPTFLIK